MLKRILILATLALAPLPGLAGDPGAPALSAPSIRFGAVTLDWTVPVTVTSTITGYTILKSVSQAGSVSTIPIFTGTTATSYVDQATDCSPTAYGYSVFADATNSSGTVTGDISDTLWAYVPCAPTGLAVSVSATGLVLSWSAPGSGQVAAYGVYRSTFSGSDALNQPLSLTAATAFTDSAQVFDSGGATLNADRDYVVAAVDALGNTGFATGAVSAPADPSALGNGSSVQVPGLDGEVQLSWTNSLPANGVSEYAVFRSTAGVPPSVPVALTYSPGASTSLFDLTGCADGLGNNFWVAAGLGAAGFGTPVFLGSGVPYSLPGAVTFTSASAAGYAGQLLVSWSAAAPGSFGNAGYYVYASPATSAFVADTGAAGYSTTLDVPCGATQTVWVRAVDNTGFNLGPVSVTAYASVPCPPSLADSGVSVSGGRVTLSWSAPTKALPLTGYLVYRASAAGMDLSQGGQPEAVVNGAGTQFSYTSQPLTQGATAFYSLYSVDSAGATSEASRQVSVLAPPTLAAPVAGLGSVSLSWVSATAVPNFGVTGYQVFYGASFSPLTLSAFTSGLTLSLTWLGNGTPYYFQVASLGGGSRGGPSQELSATPALQAPPFTSVSDSLGGPLVVSWSAAVLGASSLGGYTLWGGTSTATLAVLTSTAALGATLQPLSVVAQSCGCGLYTLGVSVSDTAGNFSATNALAVTLPAVPTGLSAIPGNTRVGLSWDSTPLATQFRVYRSTPGAAFTNAGDALAAGNSYVDTLVQNGQSYSYAVTAQYQNSVENLESGLSTATAFLSPTIPPGAPLNVLLTPLPSASTATAAVALTFTAAQEGTYPIAYYQIYRSASVGGPVLAVLTDTVQAGQPGYPAPRVVTDTVGVTSGSFAYAVQAFDTSGTAGPLTQSLSAVSLAYAPPGTPAPNGATYTTAVNGTASLAWSAAPQGSYPVSAYLVYRSTSAGAGSSGTFLTATAGLAYADTVPLPPRASPLYYSVFALDSRGNTGAGWLSLSAYIPLTTTPSSAPDAPSSVGATPGAGLVLLTWNSDPYYQGVTGYNVFRNGAFLASVAAPAYAPTQSFTDASLVYDTATVSVAVSYTVQAYLGATLSAQTPSNAVFFTPPAPQGLTLSAGPDSDDNASLALTLSWSDWNLSYPGSVSGYEIYRSTAPSPSPGPATYLAPAAGGSYVDAAVNTSTAAYYYVLTSISNSVESAAPTAPVSAAALLVPGAPQGLAAAAPPGGGLQLSWTPNPSAGTASSYSLYRATFAFAPLTSTASLAASGVTTTSYLDSGASSASPYYYAVVGFNGAGPGLPGYFQPATPSPGAATGLAAAAGYDFTGMVPTVSLSWNAPSGNGAATAYLVFRSTGAGAVTLTQTAQTQYLDDPGLTNTALSYWVQGVNLTAGPASQTVTVTAYDPAAAPQGLTAAATNAGAILSWSPLDASQGVTGYVLYRVNQAAQTTVSLTTTSASYSDFGLSNGAPYTYLVAGLNSAGQGATSSASVTPGFGTAPPPPQGFTAAAGSVDEDSLFLSWQAVGNATGYRLYRATFPLPAQPSSQYQVTDTAGVSVTDTPLTDGQAYDYALQAYNSLGLRSAAVTATASPFRYPSQVSLTLHQAGVDRVDLAWNPPLDPGSAGVLAYRVYRSTQSQPDFAQVQASGGLLAQVTQTAYSDLQVQQGLTYAYFITVVDGLGRESPYATAQFGLTINQPPSAPQNLAAVAGDRQVTLLWLANQTDNSTGLTYNVYRALSSSASLIYFSAPYLYNQPPQTAPQGSTYYTTSLVDSSGLQDKQQYFYAIAALNSAGEGPKSQVISVIPYAPLSGQGGLQASLVNKNQASLSWGPISTPDTAKSYPLSFFDVYRSQDAGATYARIATVNAVSQTAGGSYLDQGLTFGGYYVYRVAPVDTQGNVGISYSVAKVSVPKAVNDLLLDHNAIYPGQGQTLGVQFSQVQPGHVWIKVFTLEGEYVATLVDTEVPQASVADPYISPVYTWKGTTQDGRTVASGVYIIHLEGPNNRTNARVAVIK